MVGADTEATGIASKVIAGADTVTMSAVTLTGAVAGFAGVGSTLQSSCEQIGQSACLSVQWLAFFAGFSQHDDASFCTRQNAIGATANVPEASTRSATRL